MLPEGMVHALELLHRLIAPGGRLVDIHPSGEPPVISARLANGDEIPIGNLLESDDFIEYRQADDALAQAVARGWYAVEEQSFFSFSVHAGSMDELANYLKEEYSDAVLPAETYEKAQWLEKQGRRVNEIVTVENIRIARLRPEKI